MSQRDPKAKTKETDGDSKEPSLAVKSFYEEARKTIPLEIECDKGFKTAIIEEISLNRPGLALAGFYSYFADKRVQVFGLAELSYLKSLSQADQADRLKQFFSKRIPCVAMSRNRKPLKAMVELAARYSVPILRTEMITKHFINAATIIMENMTSPTVHLHGTLVDILGMGVLIQGDPGIGKSETALALIERGHSMVSDDVTILRRANSGEIIGTAAELTRYHMEIRGLGIIHVPSLFGVAAMRDSKRLDLIVRLVRWTDATDVDRTGLQNDTKQIHGEDIPYLMLPVAPGRDMAYVVEVAALNQRLKTLGHDAAKELDVKLMARLAKRGVE